jgi:hypothetical protein
MEIAVGGKKIRGPELGKSGSEKCLLWEAAEGFRKTSKGPAPRVPKKDTRRKYIWELGLDCFGSSLPKLLFELAL